MFWYIIPCIKSTKRLKGKYMPEIGDIIQSKQGRILLVLAQTDTIIEKLDDIITTLEPIIIAVPVRFDHFTKEGFLVVYKYSSMSKPMIVEYYNREYLYESEIEKEIGIITNNKVLSDICQLMRNENVELKKTTWCYKSKEYL